MIVYINADDYGWDKSCSIAIVKAFEENMITTSTVCANGDYLDDAMKLIHNTEIDQKIGIHFVLTEGRALTKEMQDCSTFCERGIFRLDFPRYKKLTKEEEVIVYHELEEQIRRVKEYGIDIHHIDSHHHIHNAPNVFPIVQRVARKNGIKYIRTFRNFGRMSSIKFIGKEIYNTWLSINGYRYTKYFGSAQDYLDNKAKHNKNDVIEIMVHPDIDDNGELIDRATEAPYDSPYGSPLQALIEEIHRRGDTII